MPTKSNSFKRIFVPERSKFLYRMAIRDKKYRIKLATEKIRNIIKPKENELFTSWLARNATINFLQTPTFVNKYFREYENKILNRDVDIMLNEDIAKNFETRTGINHTKIMQMSLKSYTGYLNEEITEKTRNNLISSIKIKGSYSKLNGLKFCPLCLKENDYFKKEWRLSFYTVCLKHGTFLYEKCPDCGTPLTITKRKHDIEDFNCWNCGFIFKNANPEYIHNDSYGVKSLSTAVDILDKGWFEFDNKIFYSIAYFKIAKIIAKLIYVLGYRNSNILQKEIDLHKIKLKRKNEIKKPFYLEESLALKESFVIFTTVFNIISSKESLLKFIKRNNIPIYDLKIYYYDNELPYFYQEIIWKFRKEKYSPTIEEVKNAVVWMKKEGMKVNWKSLSKLFGVWLEKRKRPELNVIL